MSTHAMLCLEHAGLNCWPAISMTQIGGWVARLGDGYTKRANSVTALGSYAGDLDADVPFCEALYLSHGLTPIFRLTEASQPRKLDSYLADRGYHLVDPTLVMTRSMENVSSPTLVERDLDGDAWLTAYARLSGTLPENLSAHKALLTRIAGPKALLMARDGAGDIAGCVLGVLDRKYVGVFDLIVRSDRRRQGHGQSLVSALLSWGAEQGAATCFLQVVEANVAARGFYRNLGFRFAYRYWYRVGDRTGGEPC